ncbi:hypothetical protein [Corynebacterium terpenotabidum]|uniref:hypothetical protein n=1 Tax=Corynebacterium terpenotabidum TaxID=89154 RepID=UPI0012ECEADD|nr:hypothetical protein [Corynebacterium terpenotabidum]
MNELALDAIQGIAGPASYAIAYEDYEKGSMSTFSISNQPVMQELPECLVMPYLHTSKLGEDYLLLSNMEHVHSSDLSIVRPRCNIMWSEKYSWICTESADGSGILFFATSPSLITDVLDSESFESFEIPSSWEDGLR